MFNEFLLGLNDTLSVSNYFLILYSIIVLVISEVLFFINIKENNNEPKLRYFESNFPFIRRKNFKTDIGFVLTCKVAYGLLVAFISFLIIAIAYIS